MDQDVWANEPYTQQDLVNQINWAASSSPDGPQILSDATNYVDGINAYIAKAESPLNAQPAKKKKKRKPKKHRGKGKKKTKIVGLASLGVRGTVQARPDGVHGPKDAARSAAHKPSGIRRAGKAVLSAGKLSVDNSGFATFLSFDDPSDPEAPTTVQGKAFPFQTLPRPSKAVQKTIALPDAGSVSFVNPVVGGAVPAGEAGQATTGSRERPSSSNGVAGMAESAGQGLLQFPRSMSNALLVSAADSASGHPLAVMGPQVSYFTPEILMEEDIHGPGIDAEGAAFPGVNLYVELATAPTTRGRRPRPARTSSTRSPSRSATRTAAPCQWTPTTTCSTETAPRWRR